MGRKVNRRELSEIFGVSPPTVSTWVAMGCPIEERGRKGKEWVLDTEAVANWRLEKYLATHTGGDLDYEEACRRREAARAMLAELDLAKRRGELVEIAEVSRVVGEEYARCKARLLSIPVRLAPQVQHLDDLEAIKACAESLIHEALDELVNYDGRDDRDGENDGLDPGPTTGDPEGTPAESLAPA